jgi:hypothetical protein
MYRFGRGFGSYGPPPSNIQTVLQNASASSGVPENILQALAYQESSYNPAAVSSAGAQGLLQIMPATGKSLGLSDPFDAQANANAGAGYLASLYAQYGDWSKALIAYNEGPGNLANQGVFPSSQSYADSILSNAGISDAAGAPAPMFGPPDVFQSSDPGSIDTSGGMVASIGAAAAGADPLVLGGLVLGVLGLIALAA